MKSFYCAVTLMCDVTKYTHTIMKLLLLREHFERYIVDCLSIRYAYINIISARLNERYMIC
ncbi:hypothetical protein Lmede01_04610 [Leuconostoc mesenteroides subsp. dextranicum]|nr:hypothetical protein Lmede01_04610 [Leuconostoc mesenteroides subsp. dextranicum]